MSRSHCFFARSSVSPWATPAKPSPDARPTAHTLEPLPHRATVVVRILAVSVVALLLLAGCAPRKPEGGPKPEGPDIDDQAGLDGAQVFTTKAMFLMTLTSAKEITLENVPSLAAEAVTQMDKDNNGKIRNMEYNEWCRTSLGNFYADPAFMLIDADRNHYLTDEEITAYAAELFYDFDDDGDLTLTRIELSAKLSLPSSPAPSQGDGGGGVRGGRGGPGGGGLPGGA